MANKSLLFLFLFSVSLFSGFSQSNVAVEAASDSIFSSSAMSGLPQDSTFIMKDSVSTVSTSDTIPPKKSNQIDAQINYASQDSIVFWSNGTGFLHGQGDVKYKNITLKADYIRVKMDSSLLYARGVTDSIGDVVGEPIFGEAETEYNSKEITYNLQTGKGYVKSAVTQQGEGYIVSEKTKKSGEDFLAIAGAKYTTCDDHDHPHFHLQIKEGKVKPGSYIVAGPSQLYVADVPLPLIIPFAFFPFTNQYSSGLLMPTYTDDLNRGLGLINGGYYFAFSDYVDMELRGDIYTKGTWALNATSNYIKKYKFRGGVNISYREDITGEKDMPDYMKSKNLSIRWNHSQDAKANPYRTLSASVNFSTSGYDRSNINSYYNPSLYSQNTKASSITFSQRFPNIPLLSINGGINVSQQTRDSTVSLSLPSLSISYSTFYPFKRKVVIGKERWYEKISMRYSGSLQNTINTKEDKLLSSSFSKDWRNGMQHSIPISASFNLFNYITVTPTFNYTERWHLRSIRKHYDANLEKEVIDTISGFNRNFNFSTGVSAQTKIYGFYIPVRKIFGDKVDRIRHVITPIVGLSYNPDFADPMWGNYDHYIKTNVDGTVDTIPYSIYEGTMYGGPGRGKSGSINFSLSNNLEMKIRNDKDTTGKQPFRIISLIDNFSLSSSYNMMADSLNLSTIDANLRLKFGNKTINLNGRFDPYMLDLDKNDKVVRVNKYTWNHGMFPRFLGTNASYSITLNNDTFKKLKERFNGTADLSKKEQDQKSDEELTEEQEEQAVKTSNKKKKTELDSDGYEEVKIPWSFNISYTVNYLPSVNRADYNEEKHKYKMVFTHNLSFSGNINLTQNWQINGSAFYDVQAKKISSMNFNVTRNLHCWTMTASIVPYPYKSYNFRIGVNASMLQDLKYEKKSNYNSNPIQWF